MTYACRGSAGPAASAQNSFVSRLYDMERHYKEVKDKWIGFAGALKQ